MKNAFVFVYGIYHALRTYAPTASHRKDGTPNVSPPMRFLQDVASWAVFMLMARLVRKDSRSDARSEAQDAALASLIGIGYRSSAPSWLDDQLSNAFRTLSSPSRADKRSDEEKKWADAHLSSETLAKMKAIQSRMSVRSATTVVDRWDGAVTTLKDEMTRAGVFAERQLTEANLDGNLLTQLVSRVVGHVNDGAAWYASIGDMTTAVLYERFAQSGEFVELRDEWVAATAPRSETTDDSGWTPPVELASRDYEDEANAARHAAELESIQAEVQRRTDGYAGLSAAS